MNIETYLLFLAALLFALINFIINLRVNRDQYLKFFTYVNILLGLILAGYIMIMSFLK